MKKERKEKHFIRKPVYEGGLKAMRHFIRRSLRYPEEAKKAGVEGTVALQYTINHLGQVIDAKVVVPLGYGCDEEAIRLVKLLQFKVEKPKGRRVLFHKKIQIHFKLHESAQNPEVKPSSQLQYRISPSSPTAPNTQPPKKKSYHYSISIPPHKA